MKKENRESCYNLFWLFIIGSIAGWVIEGLFTYLTKGIIVNHSAVVIGPFNMAYGICAVFLTTMLYKYRHDKFSKLFLIGFIGGSILEYIMSFGMELVLGFSAWDYSDMPLNINGRICFLYSLFWGGLSVFWIKYLYPLIIKGINAVNKNVGKWLMYVLIIFLIFDIILTCLAVIRAHDEQKGILPRNKFEEILDDTFNKDYLKDMFNGKWSD